jgi:hypothetical protein
MTGRGRPPGPGFSLVWAAADADFSTDYRHLGVTQCFARRRGLMLYILNQGSR